MTPIRLAQAEEEKIMSGPRIDTVKYCSSIASEAQRISCEYVANKCQDDADESLNRGDESGAIVTKLGACLESAKPAPAKGGAKVEDVDKRAETEANSENDWQFRLKARQGYVRMNIDNFNYAFDDRKTLPYAGPMVGMSAGATQPISSDGRWSAFADVNFDYILLDPSDGDAHGITIFELGPQFGFSYQAVPEVVAVEIFLGFTAAWYWCDDMNVGTWNVRGTDPEGNAFNNDEFDAVEPLNHTLFGLGSLGVGLSFYDGAMNLFAGGSFGGLVQQYQPNNDQFPEGTVEDMKLYEDSELNFVRYFIGLSFDIPKALTKDEVQKRGHEVVERAKK
jgi:hypothetical protein